MKQRTILGGLFHAVEVPGLPEGEVFLVADMARLPQYVRLVEMLDREYGSAWRCDGMGV